MHLIYSSNGHKIDGTDGHYRSASHFDEVEKNATEVTIYGDYPLIVEAYKNLGIEAVVVNNSEINVFSKMKVAELKALLDEKGIKYGSDAKKDELIALLENAENNNGGNND
ncbi:HeH/LEM domain-containing protein [Phocoenobacter skyensis]|uniref:HeH/LEM domain-containing protein n=1 Tax=Phocoenobacter skyensis TaxID=97481 RepID=A0A1H7ZYP4_9PAST|nr:HeH/LEM domain-containing protein [Pasteurella skyensis]MDP8184403.1 HeH/LEM domain-containing protein [Pasteurella skyensis]QLB22595.1 hypothetical protein A6B44_04995 [Pasteurella skyensis]SEM63403.1 HeH/LEM domain-containing protein [Pasteurella skyensis]